MRTFILANGTQKRWNHYKQDKRFPIKQLIPINNMPLIKRLQNQFKGAIVVTHNEQIMRYSERCLKLEPTKNICETISQCLDGESLFVLGDVMFTGNAVNEIKRDKSNFRFFGNYNELFALKVEEEVVGDFKNILQIASKGIGKLWNLLKLIDGDEFINFTHIKDKTRDFDCLLQYLKFINHAKK